MSRLDWQRGKQRERDRAEADRLRKARRRARRADAGDAGEAEARPSELDGRSQVEAHRLALVTASG